MAPAYKLETVRRNATIEPISLRTAAEIEPHQYRRRLGQGVSEGLLGRAKGERPALRSARGDAVLIRRQLNGDWNAQDFPIAPAEPMVAACNDAGASAWSRLRRWRRVRRIEHGRTISSVVLSSLPMREGEMARIERIEISQVDMAPKVRRTDAIQSFVTQETPIVTIPLRWRDRHRLQLHHWHRRLVRGGLARRSSAPRLIGRDPDGSRRSGGTWNFRPMPRRSARSPRWRWRIDTALWDLKCRGARLPF